MPEHLRDVNGARFWTTTQGSGPPLLNGGLGPCHYLADVTVLVDDHVTVHRFDAR